MLRMLRHALLLVVLSGAATPCFSQTNPDLQTYQENVFREVGISVATRTTPPPALDKTEQAAFRAKSERLAAKYRTEILRHA